MTIRWLGRHTVRAPYLTLCLNQKQLTAAMNHCGIPAREHGTWVKSGAGATTHIITKDDKVCCIVGLDDSTAPDGISVAALLAHEATHVYQALVRSIGEKNPGDEFMAYTVQNVTEELMREYVRLKGLA